MDLLLDNFIFEICYLNLETDTMDSHLNTRIFAIALNYCNIVRSYDQNRLIVRSLNVVRSSLHDVHSLHVVPSHGSVPQGNHT